MPFDIIGWCEAAPGTGTVGLTRAVGDSLYTRGTGDNITLRSEAQYILGVLYLAESTPAGVRWKQPSDNLYKYLLAGADLNTDPNPGYHHFFEKPIKLRPGEDLAPESINATDEDTLVAMIVGTGARRETKISPDQILRGTVDQAATALTWTAGTVTWSETPDAGIWSIIGMRAAGYKASGYGGGVVRLIGLKEEGAGQYRPGVPLELAAGDKASMITAGQFPLWSQWGIMNGISCRHDNLPDIEILSPMADTDYVVELHLKYKSAVASR